MLSIMSSSAWPAVGHLCDRCAGSSSSTVNSVCNADQKEGHSSSYLCKNAVLILQEIPRALKISAFNPTVLNSKGKQGEMSGWSTYVYSQCCIEIIHWVFLGCLCSSIYIAHFILETPPRKMQEVPCSWLHIRHSLSVKGRSIGHTVDSQYSHQTGQS